MSNLLSKNALFRIRQILERSHLQPVLCNDKITSNYYSQLLMSIPKFMTQLLNMKEGL